MMKWIGIIITLVCSSFLIEPSPVVQSADADLSVKDYNEHLLNTVVFDLINTQRVEKGLDSLVFEEALSTASRKFQSKFEFRRFTTPEKVEKKIDRTLHAETKKLGFKGGLVLPIAAQSNGIAYDEGQLYFFNKKDTETEFHLFYGVKPKKKDVNQDRDEIPHHSYTSFAKDMLENLSASHKKKIFSKSYKWGGLHLQWYYKSMNKNRIPQMKMILVLGGYQTAGMWED